MDSTTIRQSHKHPTLCTVTVDGYSSQHEGTASVAQHPENHWRLPNTDPRNEGKYLFRLHTLDIYFWKAEDANSFVAAARKKLQPDQLEILDMPPNPAAHEKAMSPVVQQLENMAIQDPAYRNGQTRSSKPGSTAFSPPPSAAAPEEAIRQETPKAHLAAFQPLAYNPASPAAPEPIKHREKTPPPVDSEAGTGLAAAAYQDHAQAMSSPSPLSRPPYGHVQSSQGLISPQPAPSHTSSYGSTSPPAYNVNSPTSAQGQRTSSVSSFPPPPPQNGRASASPYTPKPSLAPPTQSPANTTPQHSQQTITAFSPPPPPQDSNFPFYSQDNEPQESPATQILGNSYISGVRQPLQHLQPQYADYTPPGHEAQAPVGGYSSYQYSQQPQHRQNHSPANDYDIHSQVYRPTEEETRSHKHKSSAADSGPPTGRLEQQAGKVDKGVNRFFKKLEKKIG